MGMGEGLFSNLLWKKDPMVPFTLVQTTFAIQNLASEFLTTCVQLNIDQVVLGLMPPKNFKFFYEYLLVLSGFKEILNYNS